DKQEIKVTRVCPGFRVKRARKALKEPRDQKVTTGTSDYMVTKAVMVSKVKRGIWGQQELQRRDQRERRDP
ncbi:hypothetical protein ACJMK2_025229, partial [Sinanodonta woodiana]